MAAKAATTPLAVKSDQRQVGVSLPGRAPRFYRLGRELKLNLSSLAMSTAADAQGRQRSASRWADVSVSAARSTTPSRPPSTTRPARVPSPSS